MLNILEDGTVEGQVKGLALMHGNIVIRYRSNQLGDWEKVPKLTNLYQWHQSNLKQSVETYYHIRGKGRYLHTIEVECYGIYREVKQYQKSKKFNLEQFLEGLNDSHERNLKFLSYAWPLKKIPNGGIVSCYDCQGDEVTIKSLRVRLRI